MHRPCCCCCCLGCLAAAAAVRSLAQAVATRQLQGTRSKVFQCAGKVWQPALLWHRATELKCGSYLVAMNLSALAAKHSCMDLHAAMMAVCQVTSTSMKRWHYAAMPCSVDASLTLLGVPAALRAHPVGLASVHSQQRHEEQAEHLVHRPLLCAAAVAYCKGSGSSSGVCDEKQPACKQRHVTARRHPARLHWLKNTHTPSVMW